MPRTPEQVNATILDRAAGGAGKTDLFYDLRLSWTQVTVKTAELMSKDLLAQRSDGKFYTTRKGKEWLQAFKNLQEIEKEKSP